MSAHPAELRTLHLAMLDAVLVGEGLGTVADLAAAECGGPVVLIVPRLEVLAPSADVGGEDLAALRRYVLERCRGRVAPVPAGVAAEVPIATGGELLGAVLLLGDAPAGERALERLRLVSVAALTEIALAHARDVPDEGASATLLAALAGGAELGREEIVRRAARGAATCAAARSPWSASCTSSARGTSSRWCATTGPVRSPSTSPTARASRHRGSSRCCRCAAAGGRGGGRGGARAAARAPRPGRADRAVRGSRRARRRRRVRGARDRPRHRGPPRHARRPRAPARALRGHDRAARAATTTSTGPSWSRRSRRCSRRPATSARSPSPRASPGTGSATGSRRSASSAAGIRGCRCTRPRSRAGCAAAACSTDELPG